MQKIFAVLLSGSLLMVGCGKKGEKPSKKMASLNKDGEIPLLLSEGQALLNEDAVDFAFVDNEVFLEDDLKGAIASAEGDNKKNITIALGKENQSDETLIASLDLDENDFDRVQFNFNENKIRNDQSSIVKKDITLAKKAIAAGKDVVVAGHTCQMGSASYNLALSQKRAEAVKQEMLRDGLPAEKVKTLGLGYESPLVWSDSADRAEKIKDLAPNRRAEVSLS